MNDNYKLMYQRQKLELEKAEIKLNYYKFECKRLERKEAELKEDIHKLEKYIYNTTKLNECH